MLSDVTSALGNLDTLFPGEYDEGAAYTMAGLLWDQVFLAWALFSPFLTHFPASRRPTHAVWRVLWLD